MTFTPPKSIARTVAFGAALLSGVIALEVQAAELNIYSTRQSVLSETFIKRFEETSGTKVNIVYIQKGLLERLKAEGANSPADAVMTVDAIRLEELAAAGLLQPIQSAVLESTVPGALRESTGLWFGLTTRGRVIYTSKERVKPGEITTYEDLADPKWKGRICTRSGYHDYNIALLASIVAHKGEAVAEQWLKGLKANLARKPQGGDRDQIQAVGEGVCDVALGNTYYFGLMLDDPKTKEIARKVALVFPNQNDRGTHVNISGIGVTKAAKNKETAIKFAEFLVSESAQELYAAQNYEYPVKAGVGMNPTIASFGPFKIDGLNLKHLGHAQSTAVKIVDRVGFDG